MAKKEISQALLAAQAEKLATIGISKDFINLDELDATMEVLRLLKKDGKDAFAEQAKAQKKVADAEAFARGEALLKNAEKGDIATVICGSGKFAKEYEFPIVKIGEKTITVEYTEKNTPNGTVGVRYPSFAKVVAVRKAK